MCLSNQLSGKFAFEYSQLERCYEKITGYKPKISCEDLDGLNESCPAQAWPNDELKIWNKLHGQELLEAIAHEMGHIILRHKGLIALDVISVVEVSKRYGSPNRIKDFCTEINIAISHRFLLPMLHSDYGISSDLQKKLRCEPAEQIREKLENYEAEIHEVYADNDPILAEQLSKYGFKNSSTEQYNRNAIAHHIEGITAYDILKCNFVDLQYDKQVTEISPEVKKSYAISSEFLSEIYVGQDIDNQIELLKNFLDALGYPANLFKILEPFPLIKSKDKIYCYRTH